MLGSGQVCVQNGQGYPPIYQVYKWPCTQLLNYAIFKDRHGPKSQGTALHPSRVGGVVSARLISSLITIAITAIKCPDSLEAMGIHLGLLVVGLGVVRAVGWEEADDIVEVGLIRCQHLIGDLLMW